MDFLQRGAGDWLTLAPWRTREVLLIWIDTDDSELAARQAVTIEDKRDLLFRVDGRVIAVWSGKWKATARHLTSTDREHVRDLLL